MKLSGFFFFSTLRFFSFLSLNLLSFSFYRLRLTPRARFCSTTPVQRRIRTSSPWKFGRELRGSSSIRYVFCFVLHFFLPGKIPERTICLTRPRQLNRHPRKMTRTYVSPYALFGEGKVVTFRFSRDHFLFGDDEKKEERKKERKKLKYYHRRSDSECALYSMCVSVAQLFDLLHSVRKNCFLKLFLPYLKLRERFFASAFEA